MIKDSGSGRFLLKTSISDKIGEELPNDVVRQFTEENFGSYEAYLEKVRRFIEQDAVKLLDALGNYPLLYHQEKEDDIPLDDVRFRAQIVAQRDGSYYKDRLAGKHQREGVMRPKPVKENPKHLVWYVPAAKFYLSETEFSMEIHEEFVPLLVIGEKGNVTMLKTTTHHSEFHKWGNLSKDPKLYQSLTSIVKAVEEGKNLSLIRFEWSDGFCEFYKRQHKLGGCVHDYMKQHHPKLLEAPK